MNYAHQAYPSHMPWKRASSGLCITASIAYRAAPASTSYTDSYLILIGDVDRPADAKAFLNRAQEPFIAEAGQVENNPAQIFVQLYQKERSRTHEHRCTINIKIFTAKSPAWRRIP